MIHNPRTYTFRERNIMTLQLTIDSKLKLEFAFGKITQGKEMQLYGEYFPAIAPLIADYANQQVGTFSVISSNIQGTKPEMGAFTHWSSLDAHQGFYSDSRFTKVKPLRDDSLDLLSDGHFFKSLDKVIDIDTDADYAVIISKDYPVDITDLLTLSLDNESPKKSYLGRYLTLALWNESTDELLKNESTEAEVFRIRFNQPTQ